NVLNEICKNYGDVYPVYNLPNEYVILYSKETNVDFNSIFNDIKNAFMQCFSLICNGGYSETGSENCNAETVYQEAKTACDFCFVAGNGKMVGYQDIQFVGTEQNLSSYVQEIKEVLSQSEGDRIKEGVYKLRISANMVCHRQIDEVKNLFYLYYSEMVQFIKRHAIAKEACERVYTFKSLMHQADLATFNTWLAESMHELSEALSNSGKINKAKQYIRQHYNEPLTLSTVAEQLGISEGHLSRIFRQSEGCGFSHFLLATRMEVAKNLLTTTNLKIYEVAQQVGYTNTEQFSKMFKKIVGITPKAFMK
ncbi:MAG: helix-turn-helix transcriptional regulator, partial [Clostridia bacterium]|nr:helix-turn-helix transcriptional regulator [Clostridia bacterium]